jgi:hypothetical protein
VAFFGVALTDGMDPDPPVMVLTTYGDKSQESWQPFMDRFSQACVDMVLWEMVEAGPHSDGRYATEGDQAALAQVLTAVPFPRYPGEFGSRWYVGRDTILRHDPGWIAVAARTAEASTLSATPIRVTGSTRSTRRGALSALCPRSEEAIGADDFCCEFTNSQRLKIRTIERVWARTVRAAGCRPRLPLPMRS